MSKPNKDKSSGPFSVYKNEWGTYYLRYDAGDGEQFSQMLPRIPWILESLVEWLNRVVFNEETNCP